MHVHPRVLWSDQFCYGLEGQGCLCRYRPSFFGKTNEFLWDFLWTNPMFLLFFKFLSQHESGVSETGVSILTNPVNRWGSALATWQSHRQLGWSNLFLVCLGPLGSKAGVVKTTFRSGTKQDRIGWTLKIVRQPMKSGVKWGYNQQTLIESNLQLTQWKKDGLNILYP
jgi:hypothetical protein